MCVVQQSRPKVIVIAVPIPFAHCFHDLLLAQSHIRTNATLAVCNDQHSCRCVVQRRDACLEMFLIAFFSRHCEQSYWNHLLLVCLLLLLVTCTNLISWLLFGLCFLCGSATSAHLQHCCHICLHLRNLVLCSEHAVLVPIQSLSPTASSIQHQHQVGARCASSPDVHACLHHASSSGLFILVGHLHWTSAYFLCARSWSPAG